ncbi:hypothetical protein M8C21_030131 [Ambrosia artemisiifolia]|uniref:Uncharacterized protein n=1 Tax=Ambrosia artemisiifolia TaxID=4212 RepID=A0AAD5CWH9_AMBAR|nr:hypothetical protein M8C21_030131 [Ambrosia artemisiifolia]
MHIEMYIYVSSSSVSIYREAGLERVWCVYIHAQLSVEKMKNTNIIFIGIGIGIMYLLVMHAHDYKP